jgi:hypothetical protein
MDFGASQAERLHSLLPLLQGAQREGLAALLADGGAGVTVAYKEYDWGTNSDEQ